MYVAVAGGAGVRMLMALLLLLLAVGRGLAEQICDHCNCQISTTQDIEAIHNMGLICNTGTITWYGATGAIRLKLTPFIRGDFRACFVTESEHTHVKISQENTKKLAGKNYRLKREEKRTLQLDPLLLTAGKKTNEYCVEARGRDPFMLYIETVKTPGEGGVPKVVFHYDMERLDSSLRVESMDECRPCTKEEILDAYCSMDFVVIASMSDVSHDEGTDKSTVTLAIKQVIHQSSPDLFYKARRSDKHLTGHVTVPRKCGVRKGNGEFLLTGRQRLGHLALQCAPYLHEWRKLQPEAECTHG